MARFVALLRAVNVGGTGRLLMQDVRSICTSLGFERVQTYIASGNIVLETSAPAARVKSALERRLREHAGKPIEVFIRTASELKAILRANPFPEAQPGRIYAFFLGERPPADALKNVRRQANEEIRVGRREIYVHYPGGMGQSKLVISAATRGAARNMKTIAELVALSAAR